MACCIALVGCAPGMVTGRADNARLIQGPPIQDITTPFDTALSCLSGKIPEGATFAVGVIADNTGKEQYADSGTGKMVTQGAGDMVQSSLFQAGVRVVNRRDPNIPIAESNWGLRNMGDQTAADFFISGSINSLDYIPGGGASFRIAGVGPEYRQTRILIGMDLALTNAFNGEVIANIPLQKQIYADETGLSSGRFFGNTLVDIDAGAMQREALHHALRQMLSYATLDLLAQVIDPATAQDCMSRINSADAQLMQLPVRRAKGPKRPSLQAMIAEAAAAPAVMPAPPAGAAPAGAPAPQQAAPTVEVQPNSPEATRLANEATTYAARAIAAAEESVRSETYDHAAGLVNNALSFVQLAVKSLREAAASGLSGPAGDAAATLVQQAALAAQEAQKLVLARPDAPPPAPPAAAAAPAPAGSAPPPVTPEDKRLGGAGQ